MIDSTYGDRSVYVHIYFLVKALLALGLSPPHIFPTPVHHETFYVATNGDRSGKVNVGKKMKNMGMSFR